MMKKYGGKEGDMKCEVESYQRPEMAYAEKGFSMTTEYIERRDKFEEKEAAQLRKQPFKGRYN